MTPQRQAILRHIAEEQNHPTAQEVFLRTKAELPHLSLATVYNCLEVLVEHDLVRQVHFDREPTRYCANLAEHGHLHDEDTGQIFDLKIKDGVKISDFLHIPEGFAISSCEITLRGRHHNPLPFPQNITDS